MWLLSQGGRAMFGIEAFHVTAWLFIVGELLILVVTALRKGYLYTTKIYCGDTRSRSRSMRL